MEQIFLIHSLLKETVTTVKMFNKDLKIIVYSPDGDTDFFDIVAWVL